jgi:hypothetical protein
MPTTNFAAHQLVPTLRSCGLLPAEIASDTKVQEVVYLLARAGTELGYRYKWEVFGPYSIELADEVRDLDLETIESAPANGGTASGEAIERVMSLFEPPQNVALTQDEWLRLVTCIDFVERRNPGATENGATPPFVDRNFERSAIDAARERVQAFLAN